MIDGINQLPAPTYFYPTEHGLRLSTRTHRVEEIRGGDLQSHHVLGLVQSIGLHCFSTCESLKQTGKWAAANPCDWWLYNRGRNLLMSGSIWYDLITPQMMSFNPKPQPFSRKICRTFLNFQFPTCQFLLQVLSQLQQILFFGHPARTVEPGLCADHDHGEGWELENAGDRLEISGGVLLQHVPWQLKGQTEQRMGRSRVQLEGCVGDGRLCFAEKFRRS